MHARALVSPSTLEQAALHSTFGAIILWSAVLVREWPLLAAGGPLCGEPESLFGHCALCWPAAGMTGIAVGLLVLTFRTAGRRA